MSKVDITQSNLGALPLKRKLSDERSYSVSSAEECLDDKLENFEASESDSDSSEALSSKKRKVLQQSINDTEQHLIENDTEELQSALVIKSFEQPFVVDSSYPIPDLHDHEVLIKNKFIGLNPIDWKGKKYRFGVYSFPWIQGRESSGIVSKLGRKVKDLSPGDEVFLASTSYRDLRTSTFQEYTVLDSRLIWKLPKNISLKHGAAIGVGLVTASSVMEEIGVDMFGARVEDTNKDDIPLQDRDSILVWGGSSGVGSYIIQLCRVAGFKTIIAVSSLKHEGFLKGIGATHVLDRFKSLDELKKDIEVIVPQGLQTGVDVVGRETSDNVIQLLNVNKTDDSQLTFVGVVSKPSKELSSDKLKNISCKEILLKKFHENVEHGQRLVEVTHQLLESGKITPQKNLKEYEGFSGIVRGLEDLEEYGASNEKYVVQL